MKRLAELSSGHYIQAPTKGIHRALEKVSLRVPSSSQSIFNSSGELKINTNANNVCDVVRGAVEYHDSSSLCHMLTLLASADPNLRHLEQWKAFDSGITDEIEIMRIKNRFMNPTTGGWADCMINFRFTKDDQGHICELQLIAQKMMVVREQAHGHKQYNEFRSAMELLEITGRTDLIEQIHAMTKDEEQIVPVETDSDTMLGSKIHLPMLPSRVVAMHQPDFNGIVDQLTREFDKKLDQLRQDLLKQTNQQLQLQQEEFQIELGRLREANLRLERKLMAGLQDTAEANTNTNTTTVH